ncbi:MAG: hypothetical protein GY782_08505 [Gammaproteobacteria bacterium]|nr:hypothetical protein [Gammaproteobacteria bacterium]
MIDGRIPLFNYKRRKFMHCFKQLRCDNENYDLIAHRELLDDATELFKKIIDDIRLPCEKVHPCG